MYAWHSIICRSISYGVILVLKANTPYAANAVGGKVLGPAKIRDALIRFAVDSAVLVWLLDIDTLGHGVRR